MDIVIDVVNTFWGILEQHVQQHSPPPSSNHQMSENILLKKPSDTDAVLDAKCVCHPSVCPLIKVKIPGKKQLIFGTMCSCVGVYIT